MRERLATLVQEFKLAFRDYLQGAERGARERARQAGRKAAEEGLAIQDWAAAD